MKIILLKDVSKLGRKFDIKTVSDGHALNLLIPRGDAIAATPDAMKRIDVERKKIEGERKVHEELLIKNIKGLEGITLKIAGKANDKGHLFAGLHAAEIAKELDKQVRLQIDLSFIILKHPLKEVGEHMIEVNAEGRSVKFTVLVEAL